MSALKLQVALGGTLEGGAGLVPVLGHLEEVASFREELSRLSTKSVRGGVGVGWGGGWGGKALVRVVRLCETPGRRRRWPRREFGAAEPPTLASTLLMSRTPAVRRTRRRQRAHSRGLCMTLCNSTRRTSSCLLLLPKRDHEASRFSALPISTRAFSDWSPMGHPADASTLAHLTITQEPGADTSRIKGHRNQK